MNLRLAALRYLLPVVSVTTALGITLAITEAERGLLLVFFLGAVVLCAYFADWRASLLATVLSVAAVVLYGEPDRTLGFAKWDDAIRLGSFLLISLGFVLLFHRSQLYREREHLLAAMVETSPTLILITDTSGRIQLFNRCCEQVTGYSREEVAGRSIINLFVPEEWREQVQRRFQDPNNPEVLAPHEHPWKTKAGALRLIEWQSRLLQRKNAPPLLLAIGVDVTDRRRDEQLARAAERYAERALLINELAHELNNPLQAVTNLLTLARQEEGTRVQAGEFLEQINNEVRRLADVSHRLLRVTKPRS